MSKAVLFGFLIYSLSASLINATLKLKKREFETVLQEQLLDNYNVNVVPKNDDEALEVSVSFTVINIRKFDEVKEVLSTRASMNVRWMDPRLAWTASTYGKVEKTTLKQSQIWLPDLHIMNSHTEFTQLGNNDMTVQVSSSGLVEWEPVITLDSTCSLNTQFFPFDHQECQMVVISWAHASDIVTLTPELFRVSPTLVNRIWEVTMVDHEIIPDLKQGLALRFVLYLKRRSDYYTIPLVLPLFAMSVLNCFAVLIPKSSGEAVSFSITVFLSYMVLMTFITDYLPRSSTDQPLLVTYIGSMLCMALVSSIYNIIAVFLSTRSSTSGNAVEPAQCSLEEVPTMKRGWQLMFWRILKNVDLLMFALVCMITLITTLWAVISIRNNA